MDPEESMKFRLKMKLGMLRGYEKERVTEIIVIA
jgi:hypothetical protein